MSQGTFTLTPRFLVRAGGDVEAAGGIGLSYWLFGEAGGDRLEGGAGNGNDAIIGASARREFLLLCPMESGWFLDDYHPAFGMAGRRQRRDLAADEACFRGHHDRTDC